MKTITIREPLTKSPYYVPVSATITASEYIARLWSCAKIMAVDIAFTPEHPNTVYIFHVETVSGSFYVWSDEYGEAGIADETGMLASEGPRTCETCGSTIWDDATCEHA